MLSEPFPNCPNVDHAVSAAFLKYLDLSACRFTVGHLNSAHQRFVIHTEDPELVLNQRNRFGNGDLREAIWPAVLHMLSVREGQQAAIASNLDSSKNNKSILIPGLGMGLDTSFVPRLADRSVNFVASDLQPSGPPVHLQRCFSWLGIDTKVLFLRGQGAVYDVFEKCMRLRSNQMLYLFDVPYDINSQTILVNPDLSPPLERRFIPLVHPMNSGTLHSYTEEFQSLSAGLGEGQGIVIATARVPVGSPDDYMTEFLEIGRRAKFFTVVDVKLEHLAKKERCLTLLEKGANFLKCDNKEFLLYLKHGLGENYEESKLDNPSEVKTLALRLLGHYPNIDLLAVSLGKSGAVFVTKDRRAWYADAIKVPVASEVGCGDSALAFALKTLDRTGGIDLILSNRLQDAGDAIVEALRAFILEGAATAMKPGADLGTPEDVEALSGQTSVNISLI